MAGQGQSSDPNSKDTKPPAKKKASPTNSSVSHFLRGAEAQKLGSFGPKPASDYRMFSDGMSHGQLVKLQQKGDEPSKRAKTAQGPKRLFSYSRLLASIGILLWR
mmetsp:Transcript_33981/g.82422  ORF Transcript_33981/g.82422 Transcript_33981/m.82422 type:complete len:105 (+) Transcript_33981:530-844(+)